MSLFGLNAAHNEYAIMNKMSHDNILKTLDFFEDSEYIIIVYELMISDLRAILLELKCPLVNS